MGAHVTVSGLGGSEGHCLWPLGQPPFAGICPGSQWNECTVDFYFLGTKE